MTALVGAAVLAVFILYLPKWWFHLFLAVFGLVGVFEARRLARNFGYRLYLLPVITTIILGIGSLYLSWLDLAWLPYLVVALSVLLVLVPSSDLSKSLPQAGIAITASAYLGFALISLAYLFQLSSPISEYPDSGRLLVVFFVLMVWAGDSAAYLVGSTLGKHKISPLISPNKTFEGAIANLIGNFLFAWLGRATLLPELTVKDVVVLALMFGILGFYGDLVESSWKRGSGIKDSGSFLPGHGGVLDRLDSIFLTAPVFYMFITRFVLG